MPWTVVFHPDFEPEFAAMPLRVRVAVAQVLTVLQERGPQLGRPLVDTLSDSDFPNMKEVRVTVPDGEWRIAFAFDVKRQAVVLCGGNKSGVAKRVFYKTLIKKADDRFNAWRKAQKER